MKTLLTAIFLFSSFFALQAQACELGDTSKTLLVLKEYDGRENWAVGEVDNSNGLVTSTQDGFAIQSTDNDVIVLSNFGKIIRFVRADARQSGSFCFKVIYGK